MLVEFNRKPLPIVVTIIFVIFVFILEILFLIRILLWATGPASKTATVEEDTERHSWNEEDHEEIVACFVSGSLNDGLELG